MKKNIYVFVMIICIFITSGCNKNSLHYEDNENYDTNFYEVRSYLEKENNWVYYMNIYYDKNNMIKYYNFNGINKKLDKIDNLYLPVTANGKEVEKWEPTCICLNYYQTYKKEFDAIDEFFNKKKFQKKISYDDLEELDIKYYSKNDLIYLFNEALSKEYKRPLGKFEYVLNSLSKKMTAGEWTVVTDGSQGYLEIVFIDYKYKDGNYLSDLEKKSSSYAIIYSKVKEIEEYIIANQEVENIDINLEGMDLDFFNPLFELVSTIS